MKNCLIIMAVSLLLSPCVTQAEQAEHPVQCIEGNPPVGNEPLLLNYGEYTDGCIIDEIGDLDRFLFNGVDGDKVRLRVSEIDAADFEVYVYDPDNLEVLHLTTSNNIDHYLDLEKTGEYDLLLNEWGNNAANRRYYLQIEKIVPDYVPLISYDCDVIESIVPRTDTDFLRFRGAQGSRINVLINEIEALDFDAQIYGPDGVSTIYDDQTSANINTTHDLTETGDYVIAVAEWGGNVPSGRRYRVQVHCPLGGCPQDPTEGPAGNLSCSDGVDNDCDKLTDEEDPDCVCTEPADCDDNDACTDDDCIDNQCQYSPVNCDDTNACTKDTCDTVSGCLNTCNVGQSCPLPGSCAPVQGQCVIDVLECVCRAQ